MWNLSYTFLMSSKQMRKFFELMMSEKSRYELQAEEFLFSDFYTRKFSSFILVYSIQDGLYSCNVISSLDGEKVLTLQVPIPETRAERIHALLELFAQSEAGADI